MHVSMTLANVARDLQALTDGRAGEVADGLREEASRLARDDRWDEMAGLIDDGLIETIAMVGEPDASARSLDRVRAS